MSGINHEQVVCYCFGVTEERIRAHFARPGATLDQLIAETNLTKKCSVCMLNLEVLLDQIQSPDQALKARVEEIVSAGQGFTEKIDRIDSGFLICDPDIKTSIRLANYPPMFERQELCTPHRYILTIFDDDGCALAHQGRVDVGRDDDRPSELPNCPVHGWFLINQHPGEWVLWLSAPGWSAEELDHLSHPIPHRRDESRAAG